MSALQLRRDDPLAPILSAVAGQDRLALETLYDRTHRWIYGLAWRIVRDRDLAEDVVLEAYLQVWQRAETFDPERGSGTAWLATVVRRRALDHRRRLEARRRHESAASASGEEVCDSDPSASGVARDRDEKVLSALDQLPVEQRQAIELAFFQGLCHREIAERLQEALGTVKTRIRLGMAKLRDLLRKHREEL